MLNKKQTDKLALGKEQTGNSGPANEQTSKTHGHRFRWWRAWWRDLEIYDAERLQAEIDRFTVEMDARAEGQSSAWARVAKEHLKHAQEHKGEIDAAWSALKAAQRELVDAYGETELLMEAARVAREAADKLHGWRKQAVDDTLPFSATVERVRKGILTAPHVGSSKSAGQTSAGGEDPSAPSTGVREPTRTKEFSELGDRVKAARVILDDHQDNVYRRLRLLRGHLIKAGWVLGSVLLLVLVTLILVLWQGWSPSNEGILLADWKSFVMAMVLGALGAALSGVLTLLGGESGQRIPDVRAQRNLVWLRPVIGAAAAVIVVGIVGSGLGGLSVDPEAAFVAALIAGSSERLVSRAVASASASITG